MKRLFAWLASFFGSISKYFGRLSAPTNKPDQADRLKTLLSKEELAEPEQKELAELVSQFEGAVIFLDAPVQALSKEGL